MSSSNLPISRRVLLACAGLALVPAFATAGDNENDNEDSRSRSFYESQTLVSDGAATSANPADGDLINAWGVAFNPQGLAWVADNGTGKSTLYDGTGKKNGLVVTIPGVAGAQSAPTGIVYNAGSANTPPDFPVKGKNAAGVDTTAGAIFIFASEDGLITGWAPSINRTVALVAKDKSAQNAIYKGLALSGDGTRHLLYATDFHNARVDVWDAAFNEVTLPTGAFTDPTIPHGYAPFGIQAIGGDLVVTYAKQDEAAKDDVKGRGFGFVDVFDANGKLIRRLNSHGVLNAPWGVALAPASFGRFGGALLIGNFGDGYINAFGSVSGRFLGTLRDPRGQRIHIDGLWGMQFGNGLLQQSTNALFVAAGPNDEQHGTYSVIRAH